jgi:hypothetical protein
MCAERRQVMKDTTNDFRFDVKRSTYIQMMDSLIRLIDTRVEALDESDERVKIYNIF